MIWLIAIHILTTSSSACENKKINIEGVDYKVCLDGTKLYSEGCQNPKECFKLPIKELEFRPNQSPLFTLCYHSSGTPFFALVEGEKFKREVCRSENKKLIDLDSLMSAYNR